VQPSFPFLNVLCCTVIAEISTSSRTYKVQKKKKKKKKFIVHWKKTIQIVM